MFRRRDVSLTLALCLSLTVHAWVVLWVAKAYVRDWTTLLLPPLSKLTPIAVTAPPQVPPQPPPMRVIDRMDQLGDDQSSGDALATSAGDAAQQARKASQEQASLSLDPEGTGGAEAAKPVPPSPPAFSQNAPANETPKFEVPGSSPPVPAPQPVAMAQVPGDAAKQNESRAENKTQEQDTKQPSEEREPAPIAETAVVAIMPPPSQPQPQMQPTPPRERPPEDPQPESSQRPSPAADAELPGDPAPLADSESDAFSMQDSVEFRRGKTLARMGRKHKLISPRLEMVAYADLLTMQPPVRIVLRLYIDATGNVVKADIVKSSGSVNLDVPTKQIAYRWWFEPRKDARGQPMAEVFEFVVGFS